MRKVLNLVRSNNLTVAFMVVHDEAEHAIEVVKVNPANNQTNDQCAIFYYGERVTADQAQRRARTLATSLSKLPPSTLEREIAKLHAHPSSR